MILNKRLKSNNNQALTLIKLRKSVRLITLRLIIYLIILIMLNRRSISYFIGAGVTVSLGYIFMLGLFSLIIFLGGLQ